MERRKLVLGNWKMNKTCEEAKTYLVEFLSLLQKTPLSDHHIVGIAPAYTSLSLCCQILCEIPNKQFYLGAQNVHCEESGAFTGEISFRMLQELQVNFILIGHSERRHLFHEGNDLIAKKMHAVVSKGGLPVLCIGETLEERESGQTYEVLSKQLEQGCALLKSEDSLIIAYEPVWAIGSGKVASYDDVNLVHAFCRQKCAQIFSEHKANETPILYGGSVNQKNAAGFAHLQDVDGLLVGGASLDPSNMMLIAKDFLCI